MSDDLRKRALFIYMKVIFGNIFTDESEGGLHVAVPNVPAKRPPGRPRIVGRRSKKPGNLSIEE